MLEKFIAGQSGVEWIGGLLFAVGMMLLMNEAVSPGLGASGVIGVALGILLAELISKTNGIPVAISVPAILIGVVFSTVIGVVFGMLPAVKAANLNPIEALRRD